MPFHFFGPPPPHLLPIVLASALAFAAGAYLMARDQLPASLSALSKRIGARFSARRDASDHSQTAMSYRCASSTSAAGNTSFDAYRAETIAKLEAEAAEFRAYLDGLRRAKDKSEFDRFMAERRERPPASGETPGAPAA